MSGALWHHVPKGDLRPGSAVDVDPPWAAFDVVHRSDYERLVEAAKGFVQSTSYFRQTKASRPSFEALAILLIEIGAWAE